MMERNTLQGMNDGQPYQTLKSLVEGGYIQSARDLEGLFAAKRSMQVDDSCWLNGDGDYELHVKLDDTEVKIAGSSARTVGGTLSSLLLIGGTSNIQIKSFATQPRQVLPALSSEFRFPKETLANVTLLIHFCGVPSCEAWKNITSHVHSLELRQCQTEDWKSIGSPKTLILSLTLPEFASFGTSDIIATNVQKLSLVLHFWLQGDPWETFCRLLSQAHDIKTLEIQYLDLGDEGWDLLWGSLPQGIESVTLSFTDGFVDEYRRLTSERRLSRSKTVLNAASSNISLLNVSFPDCQQDESTMNEVGAMLDSRF